MALYVDIEKHYGDFHLKLTLETGNETLALLGASGCGKSLTLKCIAGIVKPDRGRIVVDDTVVFDSQRGIDLPPQKRQVGLMFQNYALFPNMTVKQNIAAGARNGKTRKEGMELTEAALSRFGLTELAQHYPHQLSGGQQQRTALARMLVSQPKVVLLDEPFSALDSHLRFQLERQVRQILREFGRSVVLVSHDRDEVFRMADKTAILNQGSLDAVGTVQQVFQNPQTRAGAMLTGCKNLSAAQGAGPGKILALDWGLTLEVPAAAPDAQVVGIRMHHIRQGPGPNQVRCQVVEEIENPFSYTVFLKPVEAPASTALGWELDKALWQQRRCRELTVCLPPEHLLLLREGPTQTKK